MGVGATVEKGNPERKDLYRSEGWLWGWGGVHEESCTVLAQRG